MDDWHYGRLIRASAFRLADRLIVRVDGVKPTPCHQVELRQYVPDREGSPDLQLGLYWRQAPGPCEVRRTRYVARMEVRVGRMPVDRVRIDHADRYLDVPVEPVPFASAPPLDGGALYTGWSRGSFEAAYREAVALIPRRDAEDLVHARIVDQGGLHGGEAGLDDLFVTVRRVDVVPSAGLGRGVDGARSPRHPPYVRPLRPDPG